MLNEKEIECELEAMRRALVIRNYAVKNIRSVSTAGLHAPEACCFTDSYSKPATPNR